MSLPIKKGLTLIEVVVALGILAIVFAGVVTLIVQIVSLELSSRDRTQGIALAQGKLSEVTASISNGCSNVSPVTNAAPILFDVPNSRFSYVVAENTGINYGAAPYIIASPDYSEITVSVFWDDRVSENNSIKLTQVVKKCADD